MSKNSKIMKIGFNVGSDEILDGKDFYNLPVNAGKGIDFAVCHFSPQRYTLEENISMVKKTAEELASKNAEFIANFEYQNWNKNPVSPDGIKWTDDEGGAHRLKLHEDFVKALAAEKNFAGLMYDEFEHAIINDNLSIILSSKRKDILPVFPLDNSKNVLQQGELLDKQLNEFVTGYKQLGPKYFTGEHVFPVLFHRFARNGIVPNFKSQKESYSNVQFACAAGAALQYDTPLWNCVDLWFRNTFPGHSPKEMYNNLMFAYYAGVNRVYVEYANAFEKNKSLTAYGKAFERFSNGFKGKDRQYDIHDYRPEIAIIKYDDGFWGQNDPIMWRPMLFGNKKLRPEGKSYEWIKAMHTVTHGETSKNSVSWDKVAPWSLRTHRSFASMNSAVVFDERVRAKNLMSLRLCFLCGCYISIETLDDVRMCVRENGLTVVTSKRYLPAGLKVRLINGIGEVRDGKGLWIVTDNFASNGLKYRLRGFLGNKDEIRLTFAEEEVTLRISDDGESIAPIIKKK